jgi:two-component sensor histidine kinase
MRREPWIERLPLLADRPWLALAITLATVAAALALRLLLVSVMPAGMPFVTFFPTVLMIAFLLGARMGAIATAASILGAWYFFTDPLRATFMFGTGPAIVPFLVLAALNLAIFHWLQATNAKLRHERARSAALAETRETLFRELQHRVSNNLQVAAGLLALQKKHVADGAARVAVDEASRRLTVIGRISRQLYESDGGPRSMRDFLQPLCADVIEMSGRQGVTCEVIADEDVKLEPDAALPLALVVAEAVANAIEHGFADSETGRIEIELTREASGAIAIEVRDDGKGLPEGFDIATSSSLGLGIARTFVEQLGGSFALSGGERTIARLVVPG